MSNEVTGQCQCGYVRYRLSGRPMTTYVCHCYDCQKQSSSAFGISMWVQKSDLTFDGGEPSVYVTHGGSGAKKVCTFCPQCGSRIYHGFDDENGPVSLKAGTLDDTSRIRPNAHIWTRSAQPWVAIDQEKMRCWEAEPDREEIMRLWDEQEKANQS